MDGKDEALSRPYTGATGIIAPSMDRYSRRVNSFFLEIPISIPISAGGQTTAQAHRVVFDRHMYRYDQQLVVRGMHVLHCQNIKSCIHLIGSMLFASIVPPL